MKHFQRPGEVSNVARTVRRALRPEGRSYVVPWGGSKGGARLKKTGQPEWFGRMKWEAQQKVLLGQLPVSALAVHGICTGKQAEALREAGFKTVWDVASATYSGMLKVTGFGPKTLAKLWQDAKIKGQINMKWSADGR